MVQERPGRRELASSHHVARYCRRRDIRNNGAVSPAAFEFRPGEEYLSTNWLEYFRNLDRQSQIAGVRRALTDKGFRIRPSAAFAVLNVGDATDACQTELNRSIQFVALGEPHDPSHTGIFGYTVADTDTAAALAKTVREVHPAAA